MLNKRNNAQKEAKASALAEQADQLQSQKAILKEQITDQSPDKINVFFKSDGPFKVDRKIFLGTETGIEQAIDFILKYQTAGLFEHYICSKISTEEKLEQSVTKEYAYTKKPADFQADIINIYFFTHERNGFECVSLRADEVGIEFASEIVLDELKRNEGLFCTYSDMRQYSDDSRGYEEFRGFPNGVTISGSLDYGYDNYKDAEE